MERRIIIDLVEGDTAPDLTVRFPGLVLGDYDSITMKVRLADLTGFERAVTPTATQGTVTDTTSYPCDDQDGKTVKVTIDGGDEQTVTLSGEHILATQIAASLTAQLAGCIVGLDGGQVKITSNTKGVGSSVAIGTGTATRLIWGTPVDGVGDNEVGTVTWQAGDLIAGRHQAEFEFTLGTDTFTVPRKYPVELSVRKDL